MAEEGGGGVPAAGGAEGILAELRGGGELMIASILARSGSVSVGVVNDSAEASPMGFSFSLSKTWVASLSSSQSMSSFAPFFAWAGAGLLVGRTAGRTLGGGAIAGTFWEAACGVPSLVGGWLFGAVRFGSVPRPGGGGGLLSAEGAALAGRVEPDGGGGGAAAEGVAVAGIADADA